jgi:DNA-binding NarL/FixJ family response regulator
MTSDEAVALALDASPETDSNTVALTALGPDQQTTAPPGVLTPREREVVALVASGRSNKAIAKELFISPATAARHVANIMGKLGFNTRAQIAAWAANQPPHISDHGEDPPSVRQA